MLERGDGLEAIEPFMGELLAAVEPAVPAGSRLPPARRGARIHPDAVEMEQVQPRIVQQFGHRRGEADHPRADRPGRNHLRIAEPVPVRGAEFILQGKHHRSEAECAHHVAMGDQCFEHAPP